MTSHKQHVKAHIKFERQLKRRQIKERKRIILQEEIYNEITVLLLSIEGLRRRVQSLWRNVYEKFEEDSQK